MSDATRGPDSGPDDVPTWDDEYVDRASDRLMHTYDLAKDVRVGGERFDLAGDLRVESSKHLFHPAVRYATHRAREYLYVARRPDVSVADLERLVSIGHDLADERIEPSDEHKATEFTFVVVAPAIPADVAEFVRGFGDRTLLRYGFHGHYEVHLCVVAPGEEEIVASRRTEIDGAFALWEPIEEERGPVARLLAALSR